ncbi:hypothetical protein U1Q18_051528, partial [Sarracenia purpurea var. burkii]
MALAQARLEAERLRNELNELKSNQNFRLNNPATILNGETSYNIWRNILVTELKALDLYYTIEENERYVALEDNAKQRVEATVLSYILTRLDETNQKYVNGINTPKAVLDKLDALRNNNSLSNVLSLFRNFTNININRNERVCEYIIRFDEVLDELNRNEEQFSLRKIKLNFIQGLRNMYPDIICRVEKEDVNNDDITLDQVKTKILNWVKDTKEAKERYGNDNEGNNSENVFYTENNNSNASVRGNFRGRYNNRSNRYNRGTSRGSFRGGFRGNRGRGNSTENWGRGHSSSNNVRGRGRNNFGGRSFRGGNLSYNSGVCFHCGDIGHFANSCNSNAWVCYACLKKTTTHTAATCRSRSSRRRRAGRNSAYSLDNRSSDVNVVNNLAIKNGQGDDEMGNDLENDDIAAGL